MQYKGLQEIHAAWDIESLLPETGNIRNWFISCFLKSVYKVDLSELKRLQVTKPAHQLVAKQMEVL